MEDVVSGGALRFEAGERHRCRKVRRGTAERNGLEIAISRGYEGVDHGRDLALPIAAGGDDERAYALDGAVLRVKLGTTASASAPSLVVNLKVEARGDVEVGFEGGDFLLPAPATDEPIQRELARHELDHNLGLLEYVGYKTEPDHEARGGGPVDAHDLCVSGKRGLDPEEDVSGFAAVIADETHVPSGHDDQAGNTFQDDGRQGPHASLRCLPTKVQMSE